MKTAHIGSSHSPPVQPLLGGRVAPTIPWIKLVPSPTAISKSSNGTLFAYCQEARRDSDFWESMVFGSLEVGALIAVGAAFLGP